MLFNLENPKNTLNKKDFNKLASYNVKHKKIAFQ